MGKQKQIYRDTLYPLWPKISKSLPQLRITRLVIWLIWLSMKTWQSFNSQTIWYHTYILGYHCGTLFFSFLFLSTIKSSCCLYFISFFCCWCMYIYVSVNLHVCSCSRCADLRWHLSTCTLHIEDILWSTKPTAVMVCGSYIVSWNIN